jgi:hypothetical protein
MTQGTSATRPAPGGRMPRRPWTLAGWGVTIVLVAGWLALVEVFWLPLRVGGVVVPVSVLAAVAGNLLLADAAHRLSGRRAVAVLPAVTWLVVAVGATVRRPEGDLLLTGGGVLGAVNLGFLLFGVTAAAIGVGRALAGPARPRVSRGGPPAPVPGPTGSGNGGAR